MKHEDSYLTRARGIAVHAATALFVTVVSGWLSGCQEVAPRHRVTSEECSSCHMDEFEEAQNPRHIDVMPTTCGDCHDQDVWSPAPGFSHEWELTGAHQRTGCNDCHSDSAVALDSTPSTCVGCHAADRDLVEQPDHSLFPDDCSGCHSTEAWSPANITALGGNFVHSWPLTGEHLSAACSSCHTGEPPVYAGTPTACADCHQSDLGAVASPDHSQFSDDCAECHESTGWKPATIGPSFQHSWPLLGAHTTTSCNDCHTGTPPQYLGTPTDCVGCHSTDRDSASPSHQNFSDDCTACHGNVAWKPATFAHTWPLTGAHADTQCANCHTGNPPQYEGLPSECADCHRTDYDESQFPGHSEYPFTCADCHSTTAWTPASGGHPNDKFRINGGDHGKFACGDCHSAALGPNGAGNTDCVNCHTGEHTRERMEREHRGVNNYPNGPAPVNFCLDCHPNGRE